MDKFVLTMKKGGEILTRAKASVNVVNVANMVNVVSAVSVAALAVAGVALVLCVVMAVHSVGGMGLVGCAAGSVCDDVMSGRWSRVLGIVPVSALAVGVYLALIVSLLCVWLAKGEDLVGLAVKLLPIFAGVIVGSGIGPLTIASVAFTVFTIFSADLSTRLWS